jgi:hypothetical protein
MDPGAIARYDRNAIRLLTAAAVFVSRQTHDLSINGIDSAGYAAAGVLDIATLLARSFFLCLLVSHRWISNAANGSRSVN